MAEFDFLAKLHRRLRRTTPTERLIVPPGDDAALVQLDGNQLLFCSDMLLEGVHFDLAPATPELVGRKALAVNLSDIAAMAGTPRAAVVSLALPRAGGEALGEGVMNGIAALAAEFDVVVAGGDTTTWDGPLIVDLALTGEPHPRGSVRRGGARPDDVIYVTGPLGGSLRNGRHLRFTPRVAAAQLLHGAVGIAAMIDLSDGLAGDLRHVLTASGVGAVLEPAAIPVHADAAAREHALTDGEDFELCFTLRPEAALRFEAQRAAFEAKLGLAPVLIGRIVAAPGLVFSDGSKVPPAGYVHAFG